MNINYIKLKLKKIFNLSRIKMKYIKNYIIIIKLIQLI